MTVNLTEKELRDLESATSEVAWDAACDRIKAARDGRYPPDWAVKVLASGLVNRKTREFGR